MWTLANVKTDLDNFFWSKIDSNNLDKKLDVFKKEDNEKFRLVQNLTIGEAYFNHFMRLRNQLVNSAENFAREENLTPVLIPMMPKDLDEQLKLTPKSVDVVDRANKKICVTLLRTKWSSLRDLMLNTEIMQERRRTRSFNKLSM